MRVMVTSSRVFGSLTILAAALLVVLMTGSSAK